MSIGVTVNFFKLNGEKRSIKFGLFDTLVTARQKLGNFMPGSFRFMVVQIPVKRPRIIEPSQEKFFTMPFVSTLNASKNVSIVDVNTHVPLFAGNRTNWFTVQNGNLQVAIRKNMGDSQARSLNTSKIDPIMVGDIRDPLTNKFSPYISGSRAVICNKRTAIEFSISSWAAAAYGYSISSNGQSIVDSLYICAGDQPGRQMNTSIRRYESGGNMIVIDSTANLGISSGLKTQYAKITVKSWRVTSYKKGGKTFSSHLRPPGRRGVKSNLGSFQTSNGITWSSDDVESAAPKKEGQSDQKFFSMSDIVEDRNDVLGQMEIYFLVFAGQDRSAMDRVIRING